MAAACSGKPPSVPTGETIAVVSISVLGLIAELIV